MTSSCDRGIIKTQMYFALEFVFSLHKRNRDFQTAERRQKMVTESIFHNFVVNDAEGAERIAEALSAWTEQYLECTSESLYSV